MAWLNTGPLHLANRLPVASPSIHMNEPLFVGADPSDATKHWRLHNDLQTLSSVANHTSLKSKCLSHEGSVGTISSILLVSSGSGGLSCRTIDCGRIQVCGVSLILMGTASRRRYLVYSLVSLS